MINLSFLVIIPLFFLGYILFISNNYKLNYIPKDSENIKYVSLLEENYFIIPYVFRKYYINVINITANLFPSLLSTSFWHNISEWEKEKFRNERKDFITDMIKKIGLFLSLIVYSLLIIIWFRFNSLTGNYQLLTHLGSQQETWNLNISLGVDGISLPFILLVGFILPIVYLSNWSTIDYMEAYYILIVVLLELFLLIVFLVIDMVMFYVFFESILPLLFVLIGLYGATQKFRAGYYLFLYTLFGSLFMLLSFLKVGADTGGTFFEGFVNENFYQLFQELVWLILFFSFSVKTPLIPVHIWLPLAHSDANVSGSIILASIVLKLALYGFIRILINIFSSGTSKLTPFFYGLCCLSIIYASSTTVRQFDLKVIVAYSSIAHMASSLLGTFSDTLSGIVGSIIFGLAHGFVSPALFILVGAVLYDRCGSRIINYYRGLSDNTPIFAFLFLLFMFANMGVPLTGNFIGEFLSLLGAYQQNIFITSIGTTSVILSAVYCIYVYNRVTSGSPSPYIFTIPDMYRKEYYILLPLLVLTIILGIFPSFITSDIEFALSHCLLFTFFPAVLNNNDQDSDKLHETNCNPHNTPVVDPILPHASGGNQYPNFTRNENSSTQTGENSNTQTEERNTSQIEENRTTQGEQTRTTQLEIDRAAQTEDDNTEDDPSLKVGNPDSKEGATPFVPLNDERNQPVNPQGLQDRIENYINTKEREESTNTGSNTSSSGSESYDSVSERSISSDSQTSISNRGSEANFADDEQEENNNENNAGNQQNHYESSDWDSEAGWSVSSYESYNSRNYHEFHTGRRRRENAEEDNESQKNLSDNDHNNNNEFSHAEGSNSRNNNESSHAEGSNSRNNYESPHAESSNSRNNIEEESESKEKENTEEPKESSSKGKGKDKENTEQYKSESEREQNNYSNVNENNNNSNIYTISDSDYLNNLPDGNYIFISNYLVDVLNFIHNSLIFEISSVTSIYIFLLYITFISYYRYYILCISFKDSFNQCLIILKFWMKEIFSYISKK